MMQRPAAAAAKVQAKLTQSTRRADRAIRKILADGFKYLFLIHIGHPGHHLGILSPRCRIQLQHLKPNQDRPNYKEPRAAFLMSTDF